ncbi:MAG: hypothetical protein QGF12_07930 [SAR202 cluster bacterium]|jgi:hypothetical protein|nr:hypothetical protein [SAR202 cluster bacterium]
MVTDQINWPVTPVPSMDAPTPEAKVEAAPSPENVISWDEGDNYINSRATVSGLVVGTNTDRGSQGNPTNAYLCIGKHSPDIGRFVVKILGRIQTEFASGGSENYYLVKNICIPGLIKMAKDQQKSETTGLFVETPTQNEVSPTATSVPEGFIYSLKRDLWK